MTSKCKPGLQARWPSSVNKANWECGGLSGAGGSSRRYASDLRSEKRHLAKSIQGHQRWPGFLFLSVLKVKRIWKDHFFSFSFTEEGNWGLEAGNSYPSSARTAGPRTWFPCPDPVAHYGEVSPPSRPALHPQALRAPCLGQRYKDLRNF